MINVPHIIQRPPANITFVSGTETHELIQSEYAGWHDVVFDVVTANSVASGNVRLQEFIPFTQTWLDAMQYAAVLAFTGTAPTYRNGALTTAVTATVGTRVQNLTGVEGIVDLVTVRLGFYGNGLRKRLAFTAASGTPVYRYHYVGARM